MSAPAVRYVYDMGFDDRAFSAGIVQLAVDGGAKLIDVGSDMQINRLDGGRDHGAPINAMSKELFRKGSQLLLSNTNHEIVSAGKSALQGALTDQYAGRLFSNNYGWTSIGVLIWFIMSAAVILAGFFTYGSEMGGLALFANAFATVGALIATGSLVAWLTGTSGFLWGLLGTLFGGAFAIAGVAVGLGGAHNIALGVILLPPAIASPFLMIFYQLLRAPTVAGRKVMDEIEGFKQYLGVAEEDRLNYLHPPEKTPALFEKYLPYAIALDVENRWAERFAGVLAAAAAAGAATAVWYSGNRDIASNPGGFADRVGSALATTVASASTAPGSSGGGSSGSSGGGSSGGGGGGGGGSGW